jgi:hypothetical protein
MDSQIFKYKLESLNQADTIAILLELAQEDLIAKRIDVLVNEKLSKVDADEIENDIFASLSWIDVEDLWENSGETYHGYVEPTEEAVMPLDSPSFLSSGCNLRLLAL